MLSERAAGCGLRCPRPAAYQPPREGVEIIHVRRHQWNAPLSYVAVWRAPRAPERPPRPLSPCDASITRPAPATISATGSRGIRRRHQHSAASWPLSWWAVVLMPPPNANGPLEGGRSKTSAATKQAEGSHAVSVRRGTRRRQYLRADASLYEPVPGRDWYWLSIRCPHCGGVHLGRVRQEAKAAGPRRIACGPVWVVVRRIYRSKRTEAAA